MTAGIQMLRSSKLITLVLEMLHYTLRSHIPNYLFHKHELGLLKENTTFSQTSKKITVLGTLQMLSI